MASRRPSEPTPSVARGAALVVVAVLAGLFLLRNGIDDSVTRTPERTPGTTTGTDDEEPTDEGDDPGETTPEPTIRPPAQVTVVVLNGSGVPGSAGTYTTALSDGGYRTQPAGNADARVEATQVFFVTGFDQEAQAVATAIGVPAAATPQPLADPPPGEVGDANVVVVLGPDIASATPPAPGGGEAGPADGDDGADGEEGDGEDEGEGE